MSTISPDSCSWERSRLSHHIKRMEARGLVEREECPDDGRGAFVAITPMGRASIERAAPAHAQTVRHLFFEGLTDPDLDTLKTSLEKCSAGCSRTGPHRCKPPCFVTSHLTRHERDIPRGSASRPARGHRQSAAAMTRHRSAKFSLVCRVSAAAVPVSRHCSSVW